MPVMLLVREEMGSLNHVDGRYRISKGESLDRRGEQDVRSKAQELACGADWFTILLLAVL